LTVLTSNSVRHLFHATGIGASCGGLSYLTLTRFNHSSHNTHLMVLCPGVPTLAGIRKLKPIWSLLKQETVSGSSISLVQVCTSLLTDNHAASHHSKCFFFRPNALPAAKPTQHQSTESTRQKNDNELRCSTSWVCFTVTSWSTFRAKFSTFYNFFTDKSREGNGKADNR